jgi:5-methylcytosine-specific restriction endonuclease McrA
MDNVPASGYQTRCAHEVQHRRSHVRSVPACGTRLLGDILQISGVLVPKISVLRHQAFIAQCGRCWYCGCRMWERDPSELGLQGPNLDLKCTAEHCLPRCEGGQDHRSNIVAACMHCNQARHRAKIPLSVEAYRARVKSRLALGQWHKPWVYAAGLLCLTGSGDYSKANESFRSNAPRSRSGLGDCP